MRDTRLRFIGHATSGSPYDDMMLITADLLPYLLHTVNRHHDTSWAARDASYDFRAELSRQTFLLISSFTQKAAAAVGMPR